MDLRELRNAFGTFMTGVTVVTTREKDGTPRGFTANSFTSVSLDPPLLSVCIGKAADSIDVFSSTSGFAINILSEDQREISGLFASKRSDKFNITPWQNGPAGHPILERVCAWFDCTLHQRVDAGDHVILIGRVEGFDYTDQNGLGYVRGGYVTLGLEQAAVSAARQGSHVVVGALIASNGRMLLAEDPATGKLQPVASGLNARPGTITRLKEMLQELGVGAKIASLYAVFEHEDTGQQCIYYRATADHDSGESVAPNVKFYDFKTLPWERMDNEVIASMVRRYVNESRSQRYGVYFGNQRAGTIHHPDAAEKDK